MTPDTIKRNFLREGCLVAGETQPPHRGNSPQLKTVEKINDLPFEAYTKSVRFENLTTIDPIEKINLETAPDLLKRASLISSPPSARDSRPDRRAASHRQDHHSQTNCQRRYNQSPGSFRDRSVD